MQSNKNRRTIRTASAGAAEGQRGRRCRRPLMAMRADLLLVMPVLVVVSIERAATCTALRADRPRLAAGRRSDEDPTPLRTDRRRRACARLCELRQRGHD